MMFQELKKIWSAIKTIFLIVAFLFLFFIFVECVQTFILFYNFRPVIGVLFLILLLGGAVWFITWLLKTYHSLPTLLTPPKLRDPGNPTKKETIACAVYVKKYLDRLTDNPHLSEADRITTDKHSKALNASIEKKIPVSELADQTRRIETDIHAINDSLQRKSKDVVWGSVTEVAVYVAVSPYHAVDLLVVFYKNVRMIIKIMEIYRGKPHFAEILVLIKDVALAMTTASILDLGSKVIQNITAKATGIGVIYDDIVQGIGAAFATGIAGNSAIKRCSTFGAWSKAEAVVNIKLNMNEICAHLTKAVKNEMMPELRKHKQTATSEEEVKKENALWDQAIEKVDQGLDGSTEVAAAWAGVSLGSLANSVGVALTTGGNQVVKKTGQIAEKMAEDEGLDSLAGRLAQFGVPALVFIVVVSTSGLVGAAAITSALATLGGPLGMIGGLVTLGVLVAISKGLTEYGIEKLFTAVLKRLCKQGKSKEEVINEINKFPKFVVSKKLKMRLRQMIEGLET